MGGRDRRATLLVPHDVHHEGRWTVPADRSPSHRSRTATSVPRNVQSVMTRWCVTGWLPAGASWVLWPVELYLRGRVYWLAECQWRGNWIGWSLGVKSTARAAPRAACALSRSRPLTPSYTARASSSQCGFIPPDFTTTPPAHTLPPSSISTVRSTAVPASPLFAAPSCRLGRPRGSARSRLLHRLTLPTRRSPTEAETT